MFEGIFAYITAAAVAAASLGGCAPQNTDKTNNTDVQTTVNSSDAAAYERFTAEYSERDCDGTYNENEAVNITLSGNTAEASGGGVTVDGACVTITSGGVYRLSGTLSGGTVTVDAPKTDKVQLVLDGADITGAGGPAVYEKQCDKLFVTLEGDNRLSDSADYILADDGNEPGAALFAKHDMTINGSGSLTVNGAYRHGIMSKDDLKITGGSITVTSKEDGIRGHDSVCIKDGTVSVVSGGDGIKSSNDTEEDKGKVSIDGGVITVDAENDGIQAESVLMINGGIVSVKSGDEENAAAKADRNDRMSGGMRTPPEMTDGMNGNMQAPPMNGGVRPDMKPPEMKDSINNGRDTSSEENTESKKGVKSSNAVYITGGTVTVSAEDDAVHANVRVQLDGGMLTLSSGDDAVHADYECTVTGGDINITKCYEGLEGKTVKISGGGIKINASDDGINASDPTAENARPGRGAEGVYIEIIGGTVSVLSGSDSIDSNGDIFISGGNITLDGPSQAMDCAVDFDGSAYINGGTFAASGAAQGSSMFDDASSQPSLMMIFSQTRTEGTAAELYDENGKLIASVIPSKQYGGVIFSSPDMKLGGTYTVKSGNISTAITLGEKAVVVYDTGEAVQSGGIHGGDAPNGGMRSEPGNKYDRKMRPQ